MRQIFIGLCACGTLTAGPYAPSANVEVSDAVAAEDPRFLQWANDGVIVRGPTNITSPTSPPASFGAIEDALGPADAEDNDFYSVVSLGDGGSATLVFPKPIQDVPGPDIAVFENGFSDSFLELTHVEVSSDGVNFYRFPSVSLTQTTTQLTGFAALDPTNLHNLAGKYRAGFGTAFDLAELKRLHRELDTQRITHVRVIDVVGSINPALGTRDGRGNLINERFTTDFFSGGFDLDAVGSLSVLPVNFAEWVLSQNRGDPSPAADPSGMGVPQVVEYFTGGRNLELKVSGGTAGVEFDWLSYRVDGNFWIEGSVDLREWEVLVSSTGGGEMMANNGATVTVSGEWKKRVKVSVGGPYRFFRLGGEAP